jgi:hypothetical protein
MADPLLNELLTGEDDQIFIDYCHRLYYDVQAMQNHQVRDQTLARLRQTVLSTRGLRRIIVQHINQHPYAAAMRGVYNLLITEALTTAAQNPLQALTRFDQDLLESSLLDGRLPQVLRVEIDHLYRHFSLPVIIRQLRQLDIMVRNRQYTQAMAAQIRERRAQETFLATYIGTIPYLRHAMAIIRGQPLIQNQINSLLDQGIHVYNVIRLRGMVGNHFPGTVIPNMNNDVLSQQRNLQQILIYAGLQRYIVRHAATMQPWVNVPQHINNLIQNRIATDVNNYPRFRIMNWERYVEETLVPYYTHLIHLMNEQGGLARAG